MAATFSPDPSDMPELDIAAMIAALTASGYKVTKARASRPRMADASAAFAYCVHCGDAATHSTGVGAKKAKDRVTVGVCDDCYRFGPGLHAAPMMPADPARYARLHAAWRHAQHRWARRIAADGRWSDSAKAAQSLVFAILRAEQAVPMVRRDKMEAAA